MTCLCYRLVKDTAMKRQSLSGMSQYDATNACSVELVRAAGVRLAKVQYQPLASTL